MAPERAPRSEVELARKRVIIEGVAPEIDGGLFPEIIAEREIQGVPTVYLNGEMFANGKVDARVGKVQALWLGETRVTDIDVAFVEDAKLGGGLLGMNVLGRYRMTIDDESNKLTLSPK